jgi:hypothetical protein
MWRIESECPGRVAPVNDTRIKHLDWGLRLDRGGDAGRGVNRFHPSGLIRRLFTLL